jgi:CubicO group peptidase (beta-lactamase class C family)
VLLRAAELVALSLLLPATIASALDAERFTEAVHRGMDLWRIPGMAVAVIEDGEVAYARGFGVASIERAGAIDSDTFFINASTTKAMVAAGLLILVDEGKASLDDLLIDHLPEVHFGDPALTPQLTLRDLLTHRTGLPSTDFWTFNQGMAPEEQLPMLRAVEPVAAPRSRRIYQNTMYELIGLVIERVSGERWDSFLERRLWRPIGMRTVATRDAIPDDAARAAPHDLLDGELRLVDHSLRADVSDAAGSAWSTLDDMLLWIEFLLAGGVTAGGERLLSEAAIEAMFTPQQLIAEDDYFPSAALTQPNWISYGLGWYQQDFQGRKIDYHTGSLNGASAILGLERSAGRGVVVLANRAAAELRHALLWEVMDTRETTERQDWVDEVFRIYAERAQRYEDKLAALAESRLDIPPSLPLEAYAGSYESPFGGTLRLDVDGDGLRLETGVRRYRLTPWHADIFLLMHRDWGSGQHLRFELTPAGTIESLEAFGMAFERREEPVR